MRPTWRTERSFTFSANSAVVRPEPIFFWKGSRRMRASWTRSTRTESTRSQMPVSAIGRASIANPGLTPVPATATFAFFAAASIFRASARFENHGYASSSVVDTIGTRRFSTAATCGQTFRSAELVQSTATCGFVLRSAASTSPVTFRPAFFLKPATSPRSFPAFAGSTSTAATILKFFRAASWRATAAPIGPSPMIMTLVGIGLGSLVMMSAPPPWGRGARGS